MLRLIVARCYRDYSLKRLSQADLVRSFCGFELVPLLRGEADDVCGGATLVIGLLGVKYSQKLAFSVVAAFERLVALGAADRAGDLLG